MDPMGSIKVRPLYNKNFRSLPLPMQPQSAAQERENKSSLCIKSLSASGWRRQLEHWKSAEVGNSRFWRWRNFGKNLQGLPTFTSIQVRCLINHHNASCLVSMSIAFKCISSSRYSGALQAPAASKASLASRKLAGTDLPHGISSDLIKSLWHRRVIAIAPLKGWTIAIPSQLNTVSKAVNALILTWTVRFLLRAMGPVQTSGNRSNPPVSSTSLWRRCKFQRRTPTVLASQELC